MNVLNRRNFIGAASGAAAAVALTENSSAANAATSYTVEDQQPFNAQTRRLKLSANGRYFAALIFPTDYPTHFRLKPEIYPVCTPGGVPVTGTHEYCFIHHQSVMCGHGKVMIGDREKPYDLYRKLNFPEPERPDKWHRGFNLFDLGPSGMQRVTEARWTTTDRITIDLTLDWRTRERNKESGETLLRERRRYELCQRGRFTLIDHFTRLTPIAADSATLLADRHSFCGVRVNDLIDVEDGGTLRDSEGRVNGSGNYWDAEGDRKAPRWVDCAGKIGSDTAGIALMGHPANIRNQFYYREWGLMEVSPCLNADVPFSAAEPFQFAARHVAHDGHLTARDANELFDEFAAREFPNLD